MTLECDSKFEEKLTIGLENDMRNLQNFTRAHEILKIGTFSGSFYTKQKMYELKTERGVMHYDKEQWCKIWNRIDLPFQNWNEEFNKFWPEHLKISKTCTLMGWFCPKHIPHEKINRCLTDINRCLTDIFKI